MSLNTINTPAILKAAAKRLADGEVSDLMSFFSELAKEKAIILKRQEENNRRYIVNMPRLKLRGKITEENKQREYPRGSICR
ncbi:MAG: hypothetical protein WBM07_17070 [Chitinivibrionales bacterium]